MGTLNNRQFRYRTVLLFASFQFCGNIIEYFAEHTEKLVVYITNPRFNNKFNVIRLYHYGNLISEKKVASSGNLFLYYFLWYTSYIHVLMTYFTSKEQIYVITWQPYFLFGNSIQRLLRRLTFVYWIGDYFPPVNFSLYLLEKVKKIYHDQVPFACYLSDRINAKMNGTVLKSKSHKTIMWGLTPADNKRRKYTQPFTLCFVGVIKESQGLDLLLDVVKKMPDIHVKILGSSTQALFDRYKKRIKKYKITDRVYFPNRNFYGKELKKEVEKCAIGVGLYEVSQTSASYYADPGKIKTYAQFGLPLIMTNIADVEKYVRKFNAGEVVEENTESVIEAIAKIKKNYIEYKNGIEKFNKYFDYEVYYKKHFAFLENEYE